MKHSSDHIKDILGTAIIFTVLYLFYRSMWVITLLLPCVMVFRRERRKEREYSRKAVLNAQFRDMLESLAASLRVGYSMENALKECVREMSMTHGEDSPICEELNLMVNQIGIGMSAEAIFREFAMRSAVEDIDTFASVFSIAKRTGGDMVAIIKETSDSIAGKLDTRSEIAVLISSKRLEQNIMTMIPIGIILYIDLTSGGMLDPLYGNLTGILIMSICLCIYGAAVMLGRKLIRIEV
ncbi:MAG: type II secretion system F family protein [Parasporobacterium sp.]|nr:type II secretion system F family protein [Parasporobacterium sp.]